MQFIKDDKGGIAVQKTEKSKKLLILFICVIAVFALVIGGSSVVILQLVSKGNMSVFYGMVSLIAVDLVILAGLVVVIKKFFNMIHSIIGNLGKIADGTLTLEENKLAEREDELECV